MVWWGGEGGDLHIKISDWSRPQVSTLLSDFSFTVHLRLLLDDAGPEEATRPGQVTSPSSREGNRPVFCPKTDNRPVFGQNK